MTPRVPIWRQGTGVRSYILASAEVALRLLLPPRTTNDDATTWAEVARQVGYPELIDASTSWTRLTELDGRGAEPPILVEHPEGRTSDLLLTELVIALTLATGPRVSWHYEENPDRAGVRVELALPGHKGPGLASTYSPTTLDGPLAELSEQWDVQGFHGRAWDDTATVSLAADSYADSIILSGPARLAPIMIDTNLEVFGLSLSALNPVTTS